MQLLGFFCKTVFKFHRFFTGCFCAFHDRASLSQIEDTLEKAKLMTSSKKDGDSGDATRAQLPIVLVVAHDPNSVHILTHGVFRNGPDRVMLGDDYGFILAHADKRWKRHNPRA